MAMMATVVTRSTRTRTLPRRDARGRFVSFPTTNVPSWYVFCADSYRIPGEAEVIPIPMVERPALQPQPLPPARVVRRGQPWHRGEVVTWFLMALFVVAIGWYGLTLPIPHR